MRASMLFCLPFFSLLSTSSAFADATLSTRIFQSALAYLEKTQTTEQDPNYDLGQWASQVTSTFPTFIGVGKKGVPYEEPSAFVAGTVANVLAEMYFTDPHLNRIPRMLRKTTAGMEIYRWDSVFHFYPPKSYRGLPSRGPRLMYLKDRFLGFANTPPDADTTSVSYLTLAYDQAIRQGRSLSNFRYDLPRETLETFVQFRDLNRHPHIFNTQNGDANTGAFMTWLFDEKDPEMPRKYLARPDKGTRIPFNKNDVDCVVNANVVKLLTLSQETGAPGYAAACAHLNRTIRKNDAYSCGMYYPSRWELPYTMATAINSGVSCLEPSRDLMVERILKKQRRDGSFRNRWVARADYVQSTAWALDTLLLMGDLRNPEQRMAVWKGLHFLRSQMQLDPQGLAYWKGEVFFAATFVARFNVVWRSDAYTTATVARAFQLAERNWGLALN